jgi:hypothetical protein
MTMQPSLPEIVEVLKRTPGVLAQMLSGLSPEWVNVSEGPGTFSPRDVVAHLIYGEEADWIPRARIILTEGEARPFTPFDRFGGEKYQDMPIADLLARFAELRRQSLESLRGLNLSPAQLVLTGMHPDAALGRVTLGQLLASWAVHDLGHIRQIVRVMAKRYTEAVGPWRAYLTILDR